MGRFIAGDWGNVPQDDKEASDADLKAGSARYEVKINTTEVKTMAKFDDLLKDLGDLNRQIEAIARKYGYNYGDDFGGVKYDDSDPDQNFLDRELLEAMDSLAQVHASIRHLQAPIAYVGPLEKDEYGRYHCGDRDYSSGSSVELMVPTSNKDGDPIEAWRYGRLEYDHKRGDYYFYEDPEISIEGKLARYRERLAPVSFY